MSHRAMIALAASLAAACAPTSAPMPAPMPAQVTPDRLPGRYVGVEGMYLVVAPGASPGRYDLDMQWDLDHRGRFTGTREGAGIVFVRDGVRRTLRPTTGAETGLKYLADKSDCLTVTSGEGYCRAPSNR